MEAKLKCLSCPHAPYCSHATKCATQWPPRSRWTSAPCQCDEEAHQTSRSVLSCSYVNPPQPLPISAIEQSPQGFLVTIIDNRLADDLHKHASNGCVRPRRDEYGDPFEDYGFLKRVAPPDCLPIWQSGTSISTRLIFLELE